MKAILVGSLMIVINLVAIAATIALASWAANRDLPGFVKSLIGALCAFPAEFARMGAAWVVLALFYGGQLPGDHSNIAWVVAFRYANIPFLVAFGFFAGAAAGTATIACPGCGKPVALNQADMRDPDQHAVSIKAGGAQAKPYRQRCPSCKATLEIDPKTMKILGHQPAE